MPDFGQDDPLSAAVRGGRGLYGLSTATQPGQGGLDPLVTQAIASRQSFEERRAQLANSLQYANRRQQRSITAELRGLDMQARLGYAQQRDEQRQRDFEANQRRMLAHGQAVEADRQWKIDRETDIDEHGAAMIQGLGQLRGALRNGKITEDQYHTGLLDLGQQYPYALRHPEAAKRYEFDISEADKMRDFAQRRNIADSVKLATRYGIQPQVNQDGLPDLEATHAAVQQTDKFKHEQLSGMDKELQTKYGVPLPVASLFNPVKGHSSPDEGKTIDVPFVNRKQEIVSANLPMPLFNQMKQDFQDRYFALVPQQTQPQGQPAQGTDPRVELAQRALNDPNASDAHKAAARAILGVQENGQ